MCLELSKQTYDKRDQEEVLFDAGHGSMGIERQQLTKTWQFVLLFTHYIIHLTVLVPRYLDYHMWAQKKSSFWPPPLRPLGSEDVHGVSEFRSLDSPTNSFRVLPTVIGLFSLSLGADGSEIALSSKVRQQCPRESGKVICRLLVR